MPSFIISGQGRPKQKMSNKPKHLSYRPLIISGITVSWKDIASDVEMITINMLVEKEKENETRKPERLYY